MLAHVSSGSTSGIPFGPQILPVVNHESKAKKQPLMASEFGRKGREEGKVRKVREKRNGRRYKGRRRKRQ